MTVASPAISPRTRSAWRLAAIWTRYEVGVWLREPAAVLLNMAYPLIMMAFFYVSSPDIRESPHASLMLLSSLTLVGVVMVCLNFPANGVPEARHSDFYRFARTLPIGALPRVVGWIAAPLVCATLSAGATLLVGVLASAARPSLNEIGAIVGSAALLSIPMVFLGLALGFVLNKKTALAVSLTLALAMILFGGISGFPLPDWMIAISEYLPPGEAIDLAYAGLTGATPRVWDIVLLSVWTLAGATASILLYRRDELRLRK